MPAFNPVIKLALAVIAVAVAILIADVTFNSHASEQDIAPHATAPAQQPAKTGSGARPTAFNTDATRGSDAATSTYGPDPRRTRDW